MKNISKVIQFEVARTLKKPSFWLSTLAIPVIAAIVFGLARLSSDNTSTPDITKNAHGQAQTVQIKDDSGLLNKDLLAKQKITEATTKEAGITAVKNGQDAFIYVPNDPSRQAIEVYAKDINLFENNSYGEAANALLKQSIIASLQSDIKTRILQQEPSVKTVTYKNGAVAPGIERAIIPGIFLVLFYLASFMFSGQMLVSTTEEKENRVTEMLLTTIKGRTLIIGKIAAIIILGIIQLLVIALPTILSYFALGNSLDLSIIESALNATDPLTVGVSTALFVSSFLLLTGIAVAIGAATPTAKEANSFIGALYLPLFMPFWAFSAVTSDPAQPIVQLFSYFPLTAPTTLALRNTFGNLSPTEALVGLAVVTVCALLAVAVAIRIFSRGTVEYGRRLSLKEIFSFR